MEMLHFIGLFKEQTGQVSLPPALSFSRSVRGTDLKPDASAKRDDS